mmetsp:Transcript_11853/g.24472  ORF Transcript_11853/g.24472 Transcript_11853/m.24472 type:complete len:559 (-) Transcript_11853:3808-5484(-)
MIKGLSLEVKKRMDAIGVRGGRKLTLKIMQRKEGAKPPPKFLGHGSCHSLSRTCDLTECNYFDWKVISQAATALFEDLGVAKDDVRGMGIVVSKLMFDGEDEDAGAAKMSSWLQGATRATSCSRSTLHRNAQSDKDKVDKVEEYSTSKTDSTSVTVAAHPRSSEGDSLSPEEALYVNEGSSSRQNSAEHSSRTDSSRFDGDGDYDVPSLSQIDGAVLMQLPADIQHSVRQKMESSGTLKGYEDDQATSSFNASESAAALASGDDSPRRKALRQSGQSSNYNVDEGELALPPLSQIDKNEVMALPRHIREEILQQMISKEKFPASSPPRCSSISPNRATVRSGRTNTNSSSYEVHLRQLSVKRLMKLASVKCGNDGSISLTQLDTLPLELQLQIANNDEAPIRGRKQINSIASLYRKDNVVDERTDLNSTPKKKASSPRRMAPSFDSPRPSDLGPSDLQGSHRFQFDDMEDQEFYNDNVLPLMMFLDSCPHPSSDDLERMKSFFFTLISEKRHDEIMYLLRVINRRPDDWGKTLFERIVNSIDERLIAIEGRKINRMDL